MNRFLPLIIFLVVLAIGIGMTSVVYRAEEAGRQSRFEVFADDAIDRVRGRVHQHIALLLATNSFFAAQRGGVSQPAFQDFVAGLDLRGDFEGIRGIGYARLISTGNEYLAEQELLHKYGLNRAVWPASDQQLRTPIVLLEPSDERNRVALGYDMFSESIRRAAMQAAMESGEPRASAPVELVQEITEIKQAGFLVYLPLKSRLADALPQPAERSGVAGFVYAPFRAGDLHLAALTRTPHLPIVVETYDTTDVAPVLLFRSSTFDDDDVDVSRAVERSIEVAGRKWTFFVRATSGFRTKNQHLYTAITGAISLLLAVAMAMSSRFQQKSITTAMELRRVSEKAVQEKDLMLQEMKHRIKNSIARVLAIARQTAANSESLEDFSSSFSARLNSMANAQDMLTRSHWQRADLRELLNKELEQVFGMTCSQEKVTGPAIFLDERTTQALGLTFHELATNALKYGGISTNNGDLSVSWDIVREGKATKLLLDWHETSAVPPEEPSGSGFGTRLIDANIRGELGGTIERAFPSTGMTVRLTIPISTA